MLLSTAAAALTYACCSEDIVVVFEQEAVAATVLVPTVLVVLVEAASCSLGFRGWGYRRLLLSCWRVGARTKVRFLNTSLLRTSSSTVVYFNSVPRPSTSSSTTTIGRLTHYHSHFGWCDEDGPPWPLRTSVTFLYNDVGFRKNEPFHGSRQSSWGRREPFFLGGLRSLLAAFFEIWGGRRSSNSSRFCWFRATMFMSFVCW